MANEGIMALPQGMDMQGAQPQTQQPSVSSADSYDAAQTALGMSSPGDQEVLKAAIRENLADEQLSPQELRTFILTFEELSQNPGGYKQARQQLIDNDFVDPEDLPEEYDAEFLGAVLAVLNEMQLMQGQGAMEPMQMSPTVEGLAPMGMAQGGLADVASYLAAQGRNGDSILAHITPQEASLLKRRGGSGTINPVTGLPEFFLKKLFKSVSNVVKTVLKSPVGKILATVALATVLGPAALGLSMGTAAGLASAGVTLASGGSLKQALVSGAMGYFGGGGTIMGVNPVSSFGSVLPGAAGSALNTGLSTGLIGAGIGKLSGMSTADALKMGLVSGGSAAGMAALNAPATSGSEAAPTTTGSEGAPSTSVGDGAIGSIKSPGSIGTTGTAQDMLTGSGLKVGGSTSGLQMPSSPYGPQDFSSTVGGTGPATSYDIAPVTTPQAGLRLPTYSPLDFSKAAGGTGPATNYGLAPAAPAPVRPPGFFDKMATGAKDLYNEYLSPSRPGLPADAGLLRKYGPLALAGTAATAAFGGMEGDPANQNPAFNRNYTGSDYMRDNPDRFSGGLDTYTRPTTPDSPIVPTPSYGSIPLGQPGNIVPMGATMSPGGVAQPYNVAGLYGVPLIYGQDGQLRRMAKGGDARMTNFPRRQGPINGFGTGTSDDIPAMLSDGEFVFTAKAVRNAGDGSRRKGAARMYKLMKKLEGGAVKGN